MKLYDCFQTLERSIASMRVVNIGKPLTAPHKETHRTNCQCNYWIYAVLYS
jgi:hypothetical protein